ncbi:hypothetical protein ACHAAC_00425 [Aeromicrobium sp. CF4.19]|uniref:hypothetical protein n=1 Tax=Aeromicrobium sp. CF4.19 TaxID=3373082 RepID=UPI003EE6CDC8
MMRTSLTSILAAAVLVAPVLVVVGSAAPASAQGCGSAPGVGKRVNAHGVTEYYEDRGCGDLQNGVRPVQPPRPATPPPTSGHGCSSYPGGAELCGVGIPAGHTTMSHATWTRLYGSPQPTPTVRVGAPVTIGGGGSAGGGGGTVTVGAVENIKAKKNTSAE